jgi:hypothetical protein
VVAAVEMVVRQNGGPEMMPVVVQLWVGVGVTSLGIEPMNNKEVGRVRS